jgi:hypothetical protein
MSMAGEQQLEVTLQAQLRDVTPCAKRGIASRAMLVGSKAMTAELEVVVDPAVVGEKALRITR